MHKYLLEIGMEEFPAAYVKNAKKDLSEKFAKLLDEARLAHGDIRIDVTPRRFGVRIEELADRAEDRKEEVRGPKKAAAYKDGAPTRALEGFLRGQGADVSDVYFKESKGVEYVFLEKFTEGEDVRTILAREVPERIRSMVFPKSMRWGGKNLRFARPIRWIVSLLDDEILPFELEDIAVGRVTKGLRFETKPVEIASVADYEDVLASVGVVLSEARREAMITEGIGKLAAEVGGVPDEDADLLDEIVHIVEYPTPLIGKIRPEYLALPVEVVTTPMKDHQRYFPVFDKDGALLPYFITVRNGGSKGLDIVAKGNEKVLAARLSDAKFFYEEDLKTPLAEKVERLESLVFHEKLGSMKKKSERVMKLVAKIAEDLGVDEKTRAAAVRAAELSKADLTTHMVTEFTELEGTMGGHYARLSGEDDLVSRAIGEQYLPRGAKSALPQSEAGMLLSLADKFDSLVGFMAAGVRATGSLDPFGLRRNAIGILRILEGAGLSLSIGKTVEEALAIYRTENDLAVEDTVKDEILAFLRGRLTTMLENEGYEKDVAASVLAASDDSVPDVTKRLALVEKILADESYDVVFTVLGRLKNFYHEGLSFADFDAENESEEALLARKDEISGLAKATDAKHYERALAGFLNLAPAIDRYLDDTMILTEDETMKNARLGLVAALYGPVARIFDPAEIQRSDRR